MVSLGVFTSESSKHIKRCRESHITLTNFHLWFSHWCSLLDRRERWKALGSRWVSLSLPSKIGRPPSQSFMETTLLHIWTFLLHPFRVIYQILSVTNLKHLNVLRLHDSNFSGLIPSSLGNLSRLTKYPPLWQHFWWWNPIFSGNYWFSWSAPKCFWNLTAKSLSVLDIGDNHFTFTGSLPDIYSRTPPVWGHSILVTTISWGNFQDLWLAALLWRS